VITKLSAGAENALRIALGQGGNEVIDLFDDFFNRLAALEGDRFRKEGIPAKAKKVGGKKKPTDAEPAAPAQHETPAHGHAHGHAHHK
jgi:hypothetical protein